MVMLCHHGGSVFSKSLLDQSGPSDLGLRSVSNNVFCTSLLSGWLASNIFSRVHDCSLFHGGLGISKRLLGQFGFSYLGLCFVSSKGFCTSLL